MSDPVARLMGLAQAMAKAQYEGESSPEQYAKIEAAQTAFTDALRDALKSHAAPSEPEALRLADWSRTMAAQATRAGAESLAHNYAAIAAALDAARDYPDADGTDAAHPAWWRGEQAGTRSLIREIRAWLAPGYDPAGGRYGETVGAEEYSLNTLRDDILALKALDAAPPTDGARELLSRLRTLRAALDGEHLFVKEGCIHLTSGANESRKAVSVAALIQVAEAKLLREVGVRDAAPPKEEK